MLGCHEQSTLSSERASALSCALLSAENGGVRLDSAIPCSSVITHGPRFSAQQLHRSVHPLDTVARVTRSLRAPL
jgi:hypothetical protein